MTGLVNRTLFINFANNKKIIIIFKLISSCSNMGFKRLTSRAKDLNATMI